MEAGLSDKTLVKVQKGTPHPEDLYELEVWRVDLIPESEEDNVLYTKSKLCSISISKRVSLTL